MKGSWEAELGSAGVLCGENRADTGGGRNRKGLLEQGCE